MYSIWNGIEWIGLDVKNHLDRTRAINFNLISIKLRFYWIESLWLVSIWIQRVDIMFSLQISHLK